MSVYTILDTTLTAIANAIRAKTGKSDPIQVSNYASEIESIPSGGGEGKYQYCNIPFSSSVATIPYIYYKDGKMVLTSFKNSNQSWALTTGTDLRFIYKKLEIQVGFSCATYSNTNYTDQTLISSKYAMVNLPQIYINSSGKVVANIGTKAQSVTSFDKTLTLPTTITLNKHYIVRLTWITDTGATLAIYDGNTGSLIESVTEEFTSSYYWNTNNNNAFILGGFGNSSSTTADKKKYWATMCDIYLEDTYIKKGGQDGGPDVLVWGIVK